MKAMVCEMCSSNDLVKQDGMFVCQHCGTKYSVEEAKKLMVEGVVKIDTSDELKNLYQIARRAKDDENSENAAKYYDMLLVKDPTSWEAAFYVVYYKAMSCRIAQIESAAYSVQRCINSVLNLIKDNVVDKEEQKKAYAEVAIRVVAVSTMLNSAAVRNYKNIDSQIQNRYLQEMLDRRLATVKTLYTLGNTLDSLFGNDKEAIELSVNAWEEAVSIHVVLIRFFQDQEGHRNTVNKYGEKIKKYKPEYVVPQDIYAKKSGCYVATAVYGSYDCPEVWTLRRYRDNTLAITWYGRAFIKIYYAISPTLVKWFGNTNWFKNMWKPTLDRMVEKLNNNGVEDTPYYDKQW